MGLRQVKSIGFLFLTVFLAFFLVTAVPAIAQDEQDSQEESAEAGEVEEPVDEEQPPEAPSDVVANEEGEQPAEAPSDVVMEEDDKEPPAEEKKKSLMDMYTDSEPMFGTYGQWIRHQEKMIIEADIWGSSATVPEGYLIATFGWGTMRPYKRFDNHRKLVDILPVISFDDPFGGDGKFLEFDFNIGGTGGGFFAAAMYGVTDKLMIGVSTTMVRSEIKLDPKFTPGTVDKLGVAALEDFYIMLELLGRPRPKLQYKSDGVDWGDTILTASYNYFRSENFATGATLSINLPTAHRANPNENLTFGLGADIDTGVGAFGAGLALPFDFRPPAPFNMVTFSFSLDGMYYFPTKRRSPRFLPINQDVRDYIEAQGVEVDLFQDLTDMESTYDYTPGPWVACSAGIGVGPLSITYRHGWGFEADFDSNSPGFKKMIDEIGLVGNGDDGKIIAALSIPLTPLYIPGLVQFRFEYVTDGRNQLVFRDMYQMGVGIALPVAVPDRYKMKKGGK